MIERTVLDFEGAVTGASMARLALPADGPLDPAELADAVARADADGVAHLVATVSSTRPDHARALGRAGFDLIEVALDFRRDRGDPQAVPAGVREGDAGDIDTIVERCAELFTRSRYYNDPFFTRAQADELHRRWVRNLFRGRAAVVLVADDPDLGPVGFAGLLLDADAATGRIDLIGVAREAAGRGHGRRLVEAALAWFDARCDASFVKTQAHNLRACALYTRRGYDLHRAELTLTRAAGSAKG